MASVSVSEAAFVVATSLLACITGGKLINILLSHCGAIVCALDTTVSVLARTAAVGTSRCIWGNDWGHQTSEEMYLLMASDNSYLLSASSTLAVN